MAEDVTSPGTLHLRETEEKMRRALGLSGQSAPQQHRAIPDMHRPKRRFVADGEVPVTVLPGSGRRHEAEEPNRLDAERLAREAAERALAETQAALRDLQTRLKHAEMALSESQAAVVAQRSRADQAEAALRDAEARLAQPEAKPEPVVRRRMVRGAPQRAEPQPVKWWLAGKKTSKKV